MPKLMEPPPYSPIEPVTEILHGVPVTDPYRWLEERDSPRTREWLAAQARYARAYLDAVPGRDRIRQRLRTLLDVEAYDSLQRVGSRYFFRKRLPGQEQPCICVREGLDGSDEVLVDPAQRQTGPYTAVKLLRVSPNGRLLLYEVKQGGERSGSFEIFDVKSRKTLSDNLPHGYLRGFAFSPDSEAFYYVHEELTPIKPQPLAVYKHVLGNDPTLDVRVFCVNEDGPARLHIVPGEEQLGFLLVRFSETTLTDFYLWSFETSNFAELVVRGAKYNFGPSLLKNGRILAITNHEAPNFRLVDVSRNDGGGWNFKEIVPEIDSPIQNWTVIADRIFVSYFRKLKTEIHIFDFSGKQIGQVPIDDRDTIRFLVNTESSEDLLFERESFTKSTETCSFSLPKSEISVLERRQVPLDSHQFDQVQVWFPSKDGTQIPMWLVGLREVLDGSPCPTIMTSYGGYGVSMSPQFSVLVAVLLEKGCIFALPNIRGGSEFGVVWHEAAKRRKRQVAFDDFIAGAECLIASGQTDPKKLAIFGGSNSGLLVAAAMTQRPDLFKAVLCMVPTLDMLRYHLFDNAHIWKQEFGTAKDPSDFSALLGYSPYQQVRDGVEYPATMIVSGDADQTCNPLHARKMTARLQAANVSGSPIILDYSVHRGHSPVLPLSDRIAALTDRLAFLCDQMRIAA
jgi:prolyl oligopeptidase